MLFGLLPGASRAEQTQTPPVADAHAAETPLDAVPAAQTPTELTEAETVSISEDSVSGSYIFRNRYYTNTTFAAGGEDENYYIETATINTSNSSQRWDYFSPILVPGQPVVA